MAKPEQVLQIAVANYLRLSYPKLLWTISPAGLIRGLGQAMIMKRMGYRNGTPDILIFEPRGRFHGLILELKVKGGVVSDDQRSFISDASDRGYATAVCWDYNQAIGTVNNYMRGGISNGLPEERFEDEEG